MSLVRSQPFPLAHQPRTDAVRPSATGARKEDATMLKLTLRHRERLVLQLPSGQTIKATADLHYRGGKRVTLVLDLPDDVAARRENDDSKAAERQGVAS